MPCIKTRMSPVKGGDVNKNTSLNQLKKEDDDDQIFKIQGLAKLKADGLYQKYYDDLLEGRYNQ